MSINTPLRKSVVTGLSIFSIFLLTACPEPPAPNEPDPNEGNDQASVPATAEVQANMSTIKFTFHKDSDGKISKISDDGGFEDAVTYTGNYITKIGDIYSADIGGDGLPIETLVDYGGFKNRTDWTFTGGLCSESTSYNLEQQSNGSFTETKASEITDITFGSSNQGTFNYTTYNAGAVYEIFTGTFGWVDMKNTHQKLGPYVMMLEFTDQFHGFINIGSNKCINEVELTNQSSGSTVAYTIDYTFDGMDRITSRLITIDQGGMPGGEIRHIFTY